MTDFNHAIEQQKIKDLEQMLNMQSSVISQMLGTIQVALEEDDIEEALRLVKEFQNE